MSETIEKSYTAQYSNASSYFSGSLDESYSGDEDVAFHYKGSTSAVYDTANDAFKNNLFPNSTAHPTKAVVYASFRRTWYYLGNTTATVYFRIDGTQIFSGTNTTVDYARSQSGDITTSAVTGATKSSSIEIGLQISRSICENYCNYANWAFTFNKYAFTASTGTGIATATAVNVTSDSDAYNTANGFDGDTIRYTATISSGYKFKGWYNGSTLVSTANPYDMTVASADVTLTAKGELAPHAINISYGSTPQIQLFGGIETISFTYNDTEFIDSLPCNKTLATNGKLANDDFFFQRKYQSSSGSTLWNRIYLYADGKLMNNNISVIVSDELTNLISESGLSLSNVTYDSSDDCYVYTVGSATGMISETLAQCVAGHKYYGRCYQRRASGASAADSRFEYYCDDSANGHMVFSTITSSTDDGEWYLCSGIGEIDSPVTGTWQLRAFTVNLTADFARAEFMIIDLTEAFGSGNEPSKAWCDENIEYFS